MLVMSSADGKLARQPLLIPWLWECEHYFSSFFLVCLFCFCFAGFFVSFLCFALLVAFGLRFIACLIGVLLVLPFLRVSAELETSLWNECKVNFTEGLLVCLLFFWIDFRSRDIDKLWVRLCFPRLFCSFIHFLPRSSAGGGYYNGRGRVPCFPFGFENVVNPSSCEAWEPL